MINVSRLENDMTEIMRSRLALMELSEPELISLLHRISVLEVELQGILPLEGKLFEAITATQKILMLWQAMVECIFTVKQAKDAHTQFGNWDNEGGHVEPSLYVMGNG